MKVSPNARYLGMTATPKRTDNIDVIWHFFDGNSIFPYTVTDAIDDGIFKKPYYVYTSMNIDSIISEYKIKINRSDLSKNKKKQLIFNMEKSIKKSGRWLDSTNLDIILEKHLNKFYNKKNYYKFLLFFTECKSIHTKKNEIESAFSKVFPMCKINSIIITSESQEYRKNIVKLDTLRSRKNTIDLIFNVNMLTFGYHVNDLTGIMMYRQTISDIVYNQQIGRVLSVMATNKPIVFDFVSNLFNTNDISTRSWVVSDNKPTFGTNNKHLLLPEGSIDLIDYTKDFMDIDRIIHESLIDELFNGVYEAYMLGYVDIEYCVSKLGLQTHSDFYKLIEKMKKEA